MPKKAPDSKPEEAAEVEEVDELEIDDDFEPEVQHDVVLDPDDTYVEGVDAEQPKEGK